MQISCLIVDDEPYAVELLEAYVRQVPYLTLAGKCYNVVEALEHLSHSPADLLLLDINMPQLTGMQLAAILPPTRRIIFTTAYSEYAVESYNRNALDYLLKPITFERFLQAVEKYPRIEEEVPEPPLFIKSGKTIVKISFPEVTYIEGARDYVTIHTLTEKHIVYKRMKDLEDSLGPGFFRIHHSYIIQMRHVVKIEDNHVHMPGQRIPITDKYRASFLEYIRQSML
ncbi:LytR/AlgR family response regulator transcription factor [Chitinophaga barathri]|uniref:DNA-binding response regulator n=1 Tax=Chitinophaga barathri TaxID=1647451 RepID=A0A3N4M804_9BACT|nr:response regulator transcription factor [Chitinophaga barathri]RPD39642.1 DNA-binding response regulator [Chitinophaga barathri]